MTFEPGQSGNPAGRPKGSVNKNLAMLRDAVEKVLPLVVERALNGDAEAQRLILEKGLPKLKAIDPPIEFVLPDKEENSPARAVLLQAAEGVLPLPHVKEIMTSLLLELDKQSGSAPVYQPSTSVANAYLQNLQDEMRRKNS